MDTDLYIARKSVHALRDLIILRPGPDVECLQRLRRLVGQADAAMEDAQCKELLGAVLRYADDLFSPGRTAKWERPRMSGENYLRLQILSKLLVLQNRLTELETSRDIELQAGFADMSNPLREGPVTDTRH